MKNAELFAADFTDYADCYLILRLRQKISQTIPEEKDLSEICGNSIPK